ncbi:MAG TPA: thermonuclease family protein [Gammaproteobacteria bacterium]|nr:thermonuclease family protein [Gammaproteobacteria bacterium]
MNQRPPLLRPSLLLVIALTLSTLACTNPPQGQVVGISDGDTLKVLIDGKEMKVRLAEIDAPEKTQAFGERAKQSLSELAFAKQARVVEQDIDRYGRTVGKIYVDNLDVNAEQVRRGMAWVYPQYAKDPNLYRIEREAREAKVGLWVDANPIPPWQYRKSKRPKSRAKQPAPLTIP